MPFRQFKRRHGALASHAGFRDQTVLIGRLTGQENSLAMASTPPTGDGERITEYVMYNQQGQMGCKGS